MKHTIPSIVEDEFIEISEGQVEDDVIVLEAFTPENSEILLLDYHQATALRNALDTHITQVVVRKAKRTQKYTRVRSHLRRV